MSENQGNSVRKRKINPGRYEQLLDMLFDNANQVNNAVLSEGVKRLHRLRIHGERRMLIKRLDELNRMIKAYKDKAAKNKKLSSKGKQREAFTNDELSAYASLLKERKWAVSRLAEIKNEVGFSKYALQAYAHKIGNDLGDILPYDVESNIADDVWKTVGKLFKGEARKKHCRKVKGDSVMWGKRATTPFAVIDDSYVRVEKALVPLFDQKAHLGKWGEEISALKTKRVGLLREINGNNKEYYVLENKDGMPKGKLSDIVIPDRKVILDPGPSAMFVMTRNGNGKMVFACFELCQDVDLENDEISKLRRDMSRSLNMNNPDCFDEDGSPIAGKKKANKTCHYDKMKSELSEMLRTVAIQRKESHIRLANHVLKSGNHIIVDKTSWNALSKRKKKTTFKKNDGRAQSKSRFGKSIGDHAPGLFLSILREKAEITGGFYEEILPQFAKTSQYDHFTGKWRKIDLHVRWKKIGDKYWVQRDCYTLFYIDHLSAIYDAEGCVIDYEIDRDGMARDFNEFLEAQDRFMKWVDEHGSSKIRELTRRPKEMLDNDI